MVAALTTYKFGLKEDSPVIMKPMFMARNGKLAGIINSMTYVPKIMNGLKIAPGLNSIIYSLVDNRKTNGQR